MLTHHSLNNYNVHSLLTHFFTYHLYIVHHTEHSLITLFTTWYHIIQHILHSLPNSTYICSLPFVEVVHLVPKHCSSQPIIHSWPISLFLFTYCFIIVHSFLYKLFTRWYSIVHHKLMHTEFNKGKHTTALWYMTPMHLTTDITIVPSHLYYTNNNITFLSETLFEYNNENINKRI